MNDPTQRHARRPIVWVASGVAALTLGAFALAAAGKAVVVHPNQAPPATHGLTVRPLVLYPKPIHHIVVVVQENRSVDNLFNHFSGADVAHDYMGKPLGTVDLNDGPKTNDPDHSHGNENPAKPHGFVRDYDSGKNDGWLPNMLLYVKPLQVKTYYDLAHQWVLADQMLQANEGPSMPAHQYLIAGQSGGIQNSASSGYPKNHAPWAVAENTNPATAGCDSSETNSSIDMTSAYPGTEDNPYVPCQDFPTILDAADQHFGQTPNPSWRYYTPTTGTYWNGPWAVTHLYNYSLKHPGYNLVVDPTGQQFQADVNSGHLAPVTYIVPCGSWSDHPSQRFAKKPTETGPNWINFIVNTIGKNQTYWKDTTILVTWDDWGGWYDHVVPQHVPNVYGNGKDPYEFGYRVPLIAISPYLKNPGSVDHYPQGSPIVNPPIRTHASILHYIETTFGLGSLGAADSVSDDLSEMFDYTRTPLKFTSVGPPSPFPAAPGDCGGGVADTDG